MSFSTLAFDNEARFYLSGIFFLMTKFFEVTGGIISEEADVVAIKTHAPGHHVKRYEHLELMRALWLAEINAPNVICFHSI